MADFSSFYEELGELISKFGQDKNHYLQKGYPEAQVGIDFLKPVFIDLSPETSLRCGYNFRFCKEA